MEGSIMRLVQHYAADVCISAMVRQAAPYISMQYCIFCRG